MLLSKAREYVSLYTGMVEFLRDRVDVTQARSVIERGLALREANFLQMAERLIYAMPTSPYHRLLRHAGVDFPGLQRLVRENGLEGALERLYDAGVFITLDEFKGRAPVRREGLEFAVTESDFDNHSAPGAVSWFSSGSRSAPSRAFYSDDYLEREAAYFPLMLAAHGVTGRTVAGWRPEGQARAKYYIKAGSPVDTWFTQRRIGWDRESIDKLIIEVAGWLAAFRAGRRLPWPRLVERQDAVAVASWIAEQKRHGTDVLLDTNVTSSVRVCLAAGEAALDISGTVFRVSGEPYTRAKADILAQAGTRAIDVYGTMELSWFGFGCALGRTQDDIHLATEKAGVITREKALAPGVTVPALYYTNVLANGPKLMLNVENGDYGELEVRSCGCLWGELGLTTHLVGLRSHAKVTSEGVTFLGSDLHRVLEEVLPARFGGSPIDYQFVEEDENGLPRVSLVVAPRVGPADERALVETVLTTLYAVPGGREMTDQWRQGQTLRVVRRDPYVTTTAKILPLHVLQAGHKEAVATATVAPR